MGWFNPGSLLSLALNGKSVERGWEGVLDFLVDLSTWTGFEGQ